MRTPTLLAQAWFSSVLAVTACSGGADALWLAPSSLVTMSSTSSTPGGDGAQKRRVAITGTTGKLGSLAVTKLSRGGVPVRCLVRRAVPDATVAPKTMEEAGDSTERAAYLSTLPGVELVPGDVTDAESMKTLLEGCTSCLALHGATRRSKLTDLLPWSDPESDPSHARNVNYLGVKNILDAAKTSGVCRRVVRITGKGESPFSFFSILINMLGSMAKAWNYEGEELLRGCKEVDYTIIRPGIMGPDCPDGKVLALADNGGDLKVTPVRYSAIADLCVECLDYPNAARSTLCAMNVPEGEGEDTYAPLLAKVRPDTRDFPKSLLDENRRAVQTGIAILFAVALAGTAAVLSALQALFSRW